MKIEMEIWVPQIAGKLPEVLIRSEEGLCFVLLTVSVGFYITTEKYLKNFMVLLQKPTCTCTWFRDKSLLILKISFPHFQPQNAQ
jgi:hypothetical protein